MAVKFVRGYVMYWYGLAYTVPYSGRDKPVSLGRYIQGVDISTIIIILRQEQRKQEVTKAT